MIALNNFGLCLSKYLGTGIGSCPITDFGDLKGIGLLQKGTKKNVLTDTFTESDFRLWITGGKLQQLIGAFAFEDTTPENATEESSDGVMQSVRDGKPMYNMTFKKGYAFNKAVQSLSGFGKWDILFYFTEGIFMASDFANENIAGFDAGMLDADSYKVKSGTVTEFVKIKFQLLDSKEYNERGVFFTYDQLGFNALKIDGVIETVVSFGNNATAISTTDTEINIKISDFGNSSTNLNSLFTDAGNYKVIVNGVQVAVSAVTVNGDYNTLTIPAVTTGEVVNISLNGIVEDLEMKYYKSNILTTTVVA